MTILIWIRTTFRTIRVATRFSWIIFFSSLFIFLLFRELSFFPLYMVGELDIPLIWRDNVSVVYSTGKTNYVRVPRDGKSPSRDSWKLPSALPTFCLAPLLFLKGANLKLTTLAVLFTVSVP